MSGQEVKETDVLRELIDDGRVHVMDGAMGTELYASGVFVNVSYDGLNLETPDIVENVHRNYVNAGAEVIETNTFGANPVKLSSYGLADRTEEINRAAVHLARRSAQKRALVVGAIGPLGIRIEPLGPTSHEEAQEFYHRQVDGLLEGGVDGFVLETFSDLNEMEQAFKAVRSRSPLPVICQVTVGGRRLHLLRYISGGRRPRSCGLGRRRDRGSIAPSGRPSCSTRWSGWPK